MLESGPEKIYSLAYRSFARPPWVGPDVLDEIAAEAAEHNARHGITGILLVHDGMFVQILEGGAADVTSLVARIAADRRNERLEVLWHGHVEQRTFPDWAMGCFRLDREDPLSRYAVRILDGVGQSARWMEAAYRDLATFYMVNKGLGLSPRFNQPTATA
ncbi:BLUF domain-containing protein [Roseobacter sp. HKCCA0434]|uniref:BLUF domain-containing protein n=1 Tax=Roseobacter sp. HKCCA0434 TaxID=3079297 RepID=UPI002905C99C|nr:BLUF domain-containing protein [Roseobacter sp. HKCCA0434]